MADGSVKDDDLKDMSPMESVRYLHSLAETEGLLDSPVDINLSKAVEINLPKLEWFNHNIPPKKMKITNTGYTLILSAKWQQERPFLSSGPFPGNFVFSQMHFHWGQDDAEGSEHTIDGVKLPLEMHVVTFKSHYLTQESALKERDGVAVLVYMFKLQTTRNPDFQELLNHVEAIQKPHSSVKLEPFAISGLMKQFQQDYFLYWGSVTTTVCLHNILWLITRVPIGVSTEQMDDLRTMLDANEEPLLRNYREAQPLQDRHVFHVCPSASKYSTLLPLP